MTHVAPHRWADLAAGRVDDGERARLEDHARACDDCAEARRRVDRARGAFGAIRAAEAPELRWDHIGARIYWVTSSERRAAERHRHRRPSWRSVWIAAAAACGLAIAGLAGARLFARGVRSAEAPPASVRRPAAPLALPEVVAVELAPEPILGVITFAQGEIDLGGRPVELARPVRAGDAIVTRNGRIAVQFDRDSGFELGPDTTLAIARLDGDAVELDVSGVIDVDIVTRPRDQSFVVIAGSHRVAVRGTAFRVDHRGGELEVSCVRGQVAVSGDAGEVDVAAGPRILIAMANAAQRAVSQLSEQELAQLDRSLAVPLLPAWTDPETVFATSSLLEVEAEAGNVVEVDGVRVGSGQLALRVMSGRHQVGTDWVDVAVGRAASARVGAAAAAPAHAPASAARAPDRQLRRRQLDRAMENNAAVSRCVRPLEKRDLLDGSFVEVEIGINADGTQGHLNVVDGNVPADVQRCLRGAVDRVEFPAGPRVDLRYRLVF